MLFDQLCKTVENYEELSDLKPFLIEARFFVFDSDSVSDPHSKDDFAMPYSTTAVTTANLRDRHIVIWRQTGDDWDKGHQFLFAAKMVKLMDADSQARFQSRKLPEVFDPDSFLLVHGEGRLNTTPEHFNLTIAPFDKRSWTVSFDELLKFDIQSNGSTADHKWLANSIQHSATLIAAMNDPQKFVLESAPNKSRPPGRRFRRSHDRPQYTILHPRDIRQRMHLPDPEQGGPAKAPHERRGHYRTFHSERFIRAKGQRKWIKSTWIGEAESIVGSRRYRVVLDRLGI